MQRNSFSASGRQRRLNYSRSRWFLVFLDGELWNFEWVWSCSWVVNFGCCRGHFSHWKLPLKKACQTPARACYSQQAGNRTCQKPTYWKEGWSSAKLILWNWSSNGWGLTMHEYWGGGGDDTTTFVLKNRSDDWVVCWRIPSSSSKSISVRLWKYHADIQFVVVRIGLVKTHLWQKKPVSIPPTILNSEDDCFIWFVSSCC